MRCHRRLELCDLLADRLKRALGQRPTIVIDQAAAQDVSEAPGQLDHLVEDTLAVRDARHVEQKGQPMRRHRLHRFGREGEILLIEQHVEHVAVLVTAHETSIRVDHHPGGFGQRAQLGSGEHLPLTDDVDADLDIDAGAEGVELGRHLQRHRTRRQAGDSHQFVGQVLHGDAEDRQLAVADRALPVDELQADANAPIRALSVVDDHVPLARRFVEAEPMHRLANARQHVRLRLK